MDIKGLFEVKDRRSYRDNNEEMMLSITLLGAVIRQAFDDVANQKENQKRYWNCSGENFKNKYKYRGYKQRLSEEVSASKDACNFFETKRLERFITSHTLPIEPTYLRRKYFNLRRTL